MERLLLHCLRCGRPIFTSHFCLLVFLTLLEALASDVPSERFLLWVR